MPARVPDKKNWYLQGLYLLLLVLIFAQCTVPRKYQIDKPFLYKNTIELNGGDFTSDERTLLKQRLNNQLDDSSRLRTKDIFFFLHYIMHPPVYDSSSSGISARNMEYVMQQQGYFSATTSYKADTIQKGKQKRVNVTYTITAGKPTRIDTVGYRFHDKPELQQLVNQNSGKSILRRNDPISRSTAIGEMSRLVELFRNNGYYKFTSEEMRIRADSTVAALTTISDNPFEQLALLAAASQRRENPTVKLSVDLINAQDPKKQPRLIKYYINNIYIYPDFRAGDSIGNPRIRKEVVNQCIIHYHRRRFKSNFLTGLLFVRPGEEYNQLNYYKTINNFSKIGVWQSVNIQIVDVKDSVGKIDLVLQLIPGKRNGFDANLESSFSLNSNTSSIATASAGNLFGLSTNLSWLARNVGKEAIRMTNSIRAGVELNVGAASKKNGLINSNEFSASNSFVFPKAIPPFRFFSKKKPLTEQSFINTGFSYINRINLFSLQSFNLGIGYDWSNRLNRKYTVKFPNIEFTKLYNASQSFLDTLRDNPFLRSSFTSALVSGVSFSYRSTYYNPKHTNRQRNFRFNAEESGLLLGTLKNVIGGENNILRRYLRQFLKFETEYVYTATHNKSQVVARIYAGVGIPLGADSTLPFFKQFSGGGANSMRGWPVRGIGRGAQPQAPFSSNRTGLNDRTGDIQFESNFEYRHNIATLVPNAISLKGAVFVDVGNVWNLKKSTTVGRDSTRFDPKYFYQQLGVAAGYGLRFDVSYLVIRFDLGLRFKRPDISKNNGWQFPSANYKNLLSGNEVNRMWRYENFNLTIGINYPF